MRVGVEATAYNNVRAGIARYLHCMVSEMLSLDPDVEFVFYAPRYADMSLMPGRWRLREGLGPCGSVGNLWVQRQVPRWAAEDRLDVFWGQNHMLPLHLRRHCFRLLTVHDLAVLVCPETLAFRSVLSRRLFTARACRAADAIVADSEATARDMTRLLGISPGRIRTVYFGVHSRFQPVPKATARELVARKYGLPDDYLLTVGTIEPRKHHTVLLRALRLAQSAPLLAIIGGVGWRSESIMCEIAVMAEAGRVRHLGWVDDADLPHLYSAATALVFPSYYEGFGLPLLEAMACGCPVLCSWSSSLPELGGVAARYFRVGDSGNLAGKLTDLLSDQELRTTMSVAGLVRAQQFSFRQAAKEVLDIMRRGVEQQRY